MDKVGTKERVPDSPSRRSLPCSFSGAPQKQERDYLVIGIIIALMAMVVAGFFSLDSKIGALETALNGRIDDLITESMT